MTVVALPDGKSLLFSPVPLHEDQMAEIESLGAPAFIVIPNAGHRLDSRPFVERYPKAKVITAPGSAKGVGEAVKVDATSANLGKTAELVVVDGTDEGELAMLVHHEGGTTLVTNDIIGHVASPQGPGAWVMSRLMGFGPRPQVPRLVRRMYIKDEKALAAQLRGWAALPGLVRLVPSHGDVIDQPAPILERLAHGLGG
jgi:hypothetical protein